jgi:hypothetical protein
VLFETKHKERIRARVVTTASSLHTEQELEERLNI